MSLVGYGPRSNKRVGHDLKTKQQQKYKKKKNNKKWVYYMHCTYINIAQVAK